MLVMKTHVSFQSFEVGPGTVCRAEHFTVPITSKLFRAPGLRSHSACASVLSTVCTAPAAWKLLARKGTICAVLPQAYLLEAIGQKA